MCNLETGMIGDPNDLERPEPQEKEHTKSPEKEWKGYSSKLYVGLWDFLIMGKTVRANIY